MVMVLFTILFLQQLLFQNFNFWPLNRGWLLKWRFNCIYKIFKQFNGFSLCYQSWPMCKLICISVESVFWGWWQWKWCCCPSRTGKIIFKVGMNLNEFFVCCSYKYCYLWWGSTLFTEDLLLPTYCTPFLHESHSVWFMHT